MSYNRTQSNLISILEIENECLREQIKELKQKVRELQNNNLIHGKINGTDQEKMVERITEIICDYYKIRLSNLLGKSRKREYIKARFIAMYLIRKKAGYTLKRTGRYFNRDHTTAIHAISSITNELSLKFETDVKDDLKKIESFI